MILPPGFVRAGHVVGAALVGGERRVEPLGVEIDEARLVAHAAARLASARSRIAAVKLSGQGWA